MADLRWMNRAQQGPRPLGPSGATCLLVHYVGPPTAPSPHAIPNLALLFVVFLPAPRPFWKVVRVAELERSREDLEARVGEAALREKGAGERLAALEEEIVDAKSAVAAAGWDTQ